MAGRGIRAPRSQKPSSADFRQRVRFRPGRPVGAFRAGAFGPAPSPHRLVGGGAKRHSGPMPRLRMTPMKWIGLGGAVVLAGAAALLLRPSSLVTVTFAN